LPWIFCPESTLFPSCPPSTAFVQIKFSNEKAGQGRRVASFSGKAQSDRQDSEAQIKELHAKIGQRIVEKDFCNKPSPRFELWAKAPDGRQRTIQCSASYANVICYG
jgi:hypothetical protein